MTTTVWPLRVPLYDFGLHNAVQPFQRFMGKYSAMVVLMTSLPASPEEQMLQTQQYELEGQWQPSLFFQAVEAAESCYSEFDSSC